MANDAQRYDAARASSVTKQDVQVAGGKTRSGLVLAADSTQQSRGLPGQSHRRDTGPHQDSSNPLRPPAAGRQPSGGHAPAGHRPAGGNTRLVDNHGDLTAPYGNSWEASPILAETPSAWVTLSHRSWMNTVQAGPHPQFPNRARPIQTGHSKCRYPPKASA